MNKVLFLQIRQPDIKPGKIHFKVYIVKFVLKTLTCKKILTEKCSYNAFFLTPRASTAIAALSLTYFPYLFININNISHFQLKFILILWNVLKENFTLTLLGL